MTKTHTPLIIEGKIYVVVDAPIEPENPCIEDYSDAVAYTRRMNKYNEALAACTKYETLPEHAPYWEERIGQRV